MALRTRRRRRVSSRRRVHRNKPLSAAHKRKISLALKRRTGGRKAKSRSRTVTKFKRGPVRTKTRTVVRYRGRRSMARRRGGRSMARRAGGFLRGQAISIKSLFSRETLTVAGGAVGVSMLSTYVLRSWGAMLPGATNPIGVAVYRGGIGIAGAMLANRFNRKLAEGMLIGTAVMIINDALGYVMRATNGATAAYPRAVGGPIGGRRLATPPRTARGFTPGYSGSNSFGGALNNQSAFPNSAW